jgi:hypothetical protein
VKLLSTQLAAFWSNYAALTLLAGGVLGLVLLLGLAVWAKRSRKPLRPIALAFSMNLALLLNAEGMWVIAIDQLNLPPLFAVLVFAVFEICFLTATSLAAEQYRRTSTYAADGTIVEPGHPGRMLWVAALIAGLSGVIVASNAATITEKLLRLAVPGIIFLMWWAALTAAGQRLAQRSRFAYSPRRLAERWGWLIPDEDEDLVKLKADRQVRRMVTNHRRLSAGRPAAWWWKARLESDARSATDEVVSNVVEQLARIDRVMRMLTPDAAPSDEQPTSPSRSVPASVASSLRVSRSRHRSLRRRICKVHPQPVIVAAQEEWKDPRATSDRDLVILALKAYDPDITNVDIARLAVTKEPTVRRALRRKQNPAPPPHINGERPELQGVK